MIGIASNENDIVLDSFMGVDPTGVAALSLGGRFVGVETDGSCFSAARKRMDDII